ncbi:MAG: S1 RNA-binding domain-containing protein [Planctomycetaceae bacterium]|jgi:small subunit ribosomal protein S1|nr:S1 RNA-binding domain-containing protein [Planctomycetaceae bacterium]
MTVETDRSENHSIDSVPSPPRKRLIGSQRNPDAYRPKPNIPVVGEEHSRSKTETYPPEKIESPNNSSNNSPTFSAENSAEDIAKNMDGTIAEIPNRFNEDESLRNIPVVTANRVPVPKIRAGKMSDDLEEEFNAVFSGESLGESLDVLMSKSEAVADQEILEPETKRNATVISLHGDSVFLDLGVREQGVVSLKMFPADAEPQPGQSLEIAVVRFMPEEGLYDVSVPLAAADVRDWSQVHEGMIVEAKITKTNSGGLECEVNRLRGFIPISQIELFRVEDTEQYVGQKLNCIVEEVNPERRNLVLSRRALLNQEREEKQKTLFAELEVGQIHEGLVRKIIDAGAFVDLGGVDGFIPISALSWGRINHPSDILTEGTRVKVRIAKIDETTHRISLVYRDDASNPWSNILERFQEKTLARGKVTKIMDFGAFVELMPGVEGLVHISELSAKRVAHVREVVKEGEWVDVYILSINSDTRRISLSIKQSVSEMPALEFISSENAANRAADIATESVADNAAQSETKNSEESAQSTLKIKNPHKGPLKGGTGQSVGGEKFGLKW